MVDVEAIAICLVAPIVEVVVGRSMVVGDPMMIQMDLDQVEAKAIVSKTWTEEMMAEMAAWMGEITGNLFVRSIFSL